MKSNEPCLAGKAEADKCIIKGDKLGWRGAGELRNQWPLEIVCPLGDDSVTRSHSWSVEFLTWASQTFVYLLGLEKQPPKYLCGTPFPIARKAKVRCLHADLCQLSPSQGESLQTWPARLALSAGCLPQQPLSGRSLLPTLLILRTNPLPPSPRSQLLFLCFLSTMPTPLSYEVLLKFCLETAKSWQEGNLSSIHFLHTCTLTLWCTTEIIKYSLNRPLGGVHYSMYLSGLVNDVQCILSAFLPHKLSQVSLGIAESIYAVPATSTNVKATLPFLGNYCHHQMFQKKKITKIQRG